MTIQGMAQTTKVIAHRGAWKNTGATENSLASLKHAIDIGCYGSEFDVHMSADSVLFVLHDHSIQGVFIEKSTAAELLKIKLANGETLPTLESYLKVGKQKKTRLILEIKTSQVNVARTLALTKKCVELVKKMNVRDITDYISFSFDACLKVKELDPKASVSYLTADKSPAEVAAAKLDGIDYAIAAFKKNESWVDDCRTSKITSNVYTVNDQETMKWFLDKKIDFITTNEPELLIKLLKGK
jgi:glycerophosphoryl diester phosphodiesterase